MSLASRPARFLSRLPAILVGTGVAAFAFYFFLLRPARPSAAEASAAAPETKIEMAAEPPAPVAPPPSPAPEPVPPAPVLPAPPPPPQESPVDRLIATERWFEARAEIAALFASESLDDAARTDLAARATALNQRLLVTHPDTRDVEVADIRQGENLVTFSRRFRQLHGEYGVVQLVNNIRNVSAVRAGTRLRVPRGIWGILVDKSLFTLYLCYQGAPYKTYRCCIGADDKTPAATFAVGLKNPKPNWTAPPDWLEREKIKGPVIPYGHPKNPLGEYWIGIDNPQFTGYGIHGTNAPETIGTRASMGCVRVLNEDVVELARIAWRGMDVAVVE